MATFISKGVCLKSSRRRTGPYEVFAVVVTILLFTPLCGCTVTTPPGITPSLANDSSQPRHAVINVINRSDFDDMVLRDNPDFISIIDDPSNGGEVSPYQRYVTPGAPAVQAIASEVDTVRNAYTVGVSWLWVSDATLNGETERWLKPQMFLNGTPDFEDNPVPGEPASDCEEQANTLTSLLRAIDVAPENVRSAMGEVNFSGDVGGHVWTEVWYQGQWVQLDCTCGPYWDDGESKLVNSGGLPFNYFINNDYPVIEVWYYFNDQYFLDVGSGEGNAPGTWSGAQQNLALVSAEQVAAG